MCYERRFFVSSAKKKGFEAREVHTLDSACSPARATGSSDTRARARHGVGASARASTAPVLNA